MARIGIFIDGGYLEKTLKELFNSPPKVDFNKLVTKTVDLLGPGASVFRAYYYHCPPYQAPTPTEDQRRRVSSAQRFHMALERLPRFTVRLGKLARRGDPPNYTYEQKQVDMLLGIDVVRLTAKQQIDEVVLLAGDSDFIPAIKIAKDEGAIVHLFHGKSYHNELWNLCDERHRIDASFVNEIKQNN